MSKPIDNMTEDERRAFFRAMHHDPNNGLLCIARSKGIFAARLIDATCKRVAHEKNPA